MEFGIAIPTGARSWETAKRAETLGFHDAWFFDTPLLNAEIFVAMGAAAMQTSRIRLCTGVLIPSGRISPVAASGLASLNALAPGRVVFGVSTGFTARRTLGLPPVTLGRMETYVREVEALLRGETIEWSGEGSARKVRFLNPELELINLRDPIPTFVSAFGPKARRLTARLGAGWIGTATYPEAEAADLADMRAAWQDCGRGPAELYPALISAGCVLAENEAADSPRARAQAGPMAAIVFHNMVEQDEFGSIALTRDQFPFQAELDAYRKVYQAYQPVDARYLSNHRGHLMFLRPEETHINARAIGGLTLTGTRAQLIERLRGMRDAGYRQVIYQVVPGHEDEMMERWADVIAGL